MAEISELEKLYTPSFWCKRFTRDILLQKYEDFTTTREYIKKKPFTDCETL